MGEHQASSQIYLLDNLFQRYMLPLFLVGMLSYLVGMKRRTSRRVTCKRDNSHFLRYVPMYLSPLMTKISFWLTFLKNLSIMPFFLFVFLFVFCLSVIFLPAHPESCTHIFCFGTHILNLSESKDSQSFSGKFCNGCNDFLAGLTLYSPSESWDA